VEELSGKAHRRSDSLLRAVFSLALSHNHRLFAFDGEYILHLPRNLAGVLGKNCTQMERIHAFQAPGDVFKTSQRGWPGSLLRHTRRASYS